MEVDAVRRVVALQAQDPVGPYLALQARIEDFDPRDMDEAYRTGALVRAHLMRAAEVTAPGTVTLTDTLSGDTTVLANVSVVVDAGRPTARDDLYRALDGVPGGPRVHVVGDANSPRTALEAVYEGRIAGAFLDGLDTPEARLVTSAT